MDCSPQSSSVHVISQAGILESVISFSRGSSQPRDETPVSCIGVNSFQLSHQHLLLPKKKITVCIYFRSYFIIIYILMSDLKRFILKMISTQEEDTHCDNML